MLITVNKCFNCTRCPYSVVSVEGELLCDFFFPEWPMSPFELKECPKDTSYTVRIAREVMIEEE